VFGAIVIGVGCEVGDDPHPCIESIGINLSGGMDEELGITGKLSKLLEGEAGRFGDYVLKKSLLIEMPRVGQIAAERFGPRAPPLQERDKRQDHFLIQPTPVVKPRIAASSRHGAK